MRGLGPAAGLMVLVFLSLSSESLAQWPPYRAPGVPRSANGRLNPDAPTPRTADGKPDLSGIWDNPPAGARQGARAAAPAGPPAPTFFSAGYGFKDGLPFRPWAEELRRKRQANGNRDNPDAHCLPVGFMQFHTHPQPRQIVQTRDLVLIIYEANYGLRKIHTDGRTLPRNDPQPWWYGYSIGKWDRDTLVVTTTNFRDDGWLDVNGSPYTDKLKLTERFSRPTFGSLDIEITVDDPKAYTRPWTVKLSQRLSSESELIEFICNENERSSRHYK